MSHQHLTLSLLFLASLLVLNVSAAGLSKNLENSSPYWTSAHVRTFEGETYHIVYEPKLTWSEAVTSCANAGLVLTSIETTEQLEFLKSLVSLPNVTAPWIGASRPPTGGNFTWLTTGQVVPSFVWAAGEPSNSGDKEYYVEMWGTGANDKFESTLSYICTTKTGFPSTTVEPEEPTTVEPVERTTVEPEQPTTEQPTKPPTEVATTSEPEEPTTEQETTDRTTTTRRPGQGICTEPGVIPDPEDCTKFHVCQYDDLGQIWDSVFDCPVTTVWCQRTLECEDPDFCPCEL